MSANPTPNPPGRPRLYPKVLKSYTIQLPDSMADTAHGVGGGNFSAGIRHIIEWFENAKGNKV